MADPEAVWATMPLEALMTTVQNEAGALGRMIDQAEIDDGAYRTAWWEHWRKLPEDWGVTISQRDCDRACLAFENARRISATTVERQRVRFDAMVAVLRARSG